MPRINDQRGFIALITIVVLSAILLTIGLTISSASLSQLVATFGSSQSARAIQVADTCAEEGYQRLKYDSAYTGGTVPIDIYSCTITVSGSGSTRTVDTQVTVGNYTRRVRASITLSSNVAGNAKRATLTKWEDL